MTIHALFQIPFTSHLILCHLLQKYLLASTKLRIYIQTILVSILFQDLKSLYTHIFFVRYNFRVMSAYLIYINFSLQTNIPLNLVNYMMQTHSLFIVHLTLTFFFVLKSVFCLNENITISRLSWQCVVKSSPSLA